MFGILRSRKILVTLVGLVLGALSLRFPAAPLPPVELVTDLVLALLATHTLTDVVSLVTVAVREWLKLRSGSGSGLTS